VRSAADAIVERGLREAGYEYVVIDDCWQAGRDTDGRLAAHPERFPSGIHALADHVHSRGLKLGLYAVPGSETCANFYDAYPAQGLGSRNRERLDAQTFAEWEVDLLKYDWCRADETDGLERVEAFALMGQELRRTGRPILYAISEYGEAQPWTWGRGIAHQWRTTQDIMPTWGSITAIIDSQAELAPYAGPGGWNDPDMLQFGNGDLTLEQNRSHFAMWCMLAAPLFLGTDIRRLSQPEVDILTDRELLAIGQDPLGRQATRVSATAECQIWSRSLANGDRAVAYFNPSDDPQVTLVDPVAAGTDDGQWTGRVVGGERSVDLSSSTRLDLPAHAVVIVRWTPKR
jgi:alpha-galactosidase